MTRPPISPEAEQRYYDRKLLEQQYSYDLTKQLTFFVISAELIFCSYILLNAQVLGAVKHSNILFLLSGVAAICGMLWRLCYNETYHANVHAEKAIYFNLIKKLKTITYWAYTILSITFFVSLLVTGYQYLSNIEAKANGAGIEEQHAPSKQLNRVAGGL